ncbi:hypothetical protein QTP70_030895, partial [Hemibagrus guttatus]
CITRLCTKYVKLCLDLIIVQGIGETGVEAIRESFVHCFKSCGIQNQTKFTGCFLEALVDEAQPYISMLAAGSSNPENIVSECVINKECVTCFINVYNSRNQQCLQKFMQFFGSTPAEQKPAKEFVICSISELISLTAQC